MKIKIRAEGGSQIGFGHWSRCLFLVSCADPTIGKNIFTFRANEFKQFFLDSELDIVSLNDEMDFINEISPGDIVVVDGYDFDSAYLKLLKSKRSLIIYIDDLIYPWLDVDAIINHCPGIKPSDYVDPSPSASFFLGGDYSLVTTDSEATNQTATIERLTTLLIAMGGADPDNFTGKIIHDYAEWIKTFEKVVLIIGSTHPALKELNEYALENNIALHISISKGEVRDLMKRAGVAILSSSTMALEYAHIGGLLGIVQTADNQKNLYRGLIQYGGAMGIEDLVKSNDLTDLYGRNISVQRRSFDGLSADRYRKLFKELELQGKIRLRKATATDAQLTFKWASNSSIRMFSFSQREISWSEHESWFEKKITDKTTLYLIAEIGSDTIGSIRFDINEQETIVSYLIDKSSQGQGLGRVLLAEGIKELQKTNLQVNTIIGYVMRSNSISVRIFERMGFLQEQADAKYPDSIKFYKKLK